MRTRTFAPRSSRRSPSTHRRAPCAWCRAPNHILMAMRLDHWRTRCRAPNHILLDMCLDHWRTLCSWPTRAPHARVALAESTAGLFIGNVCIHSAAGAPAVFAPAPAPAAQARSRAPSGCWSASATMRSTSAWPPRAASRGASRTGSTGRRSGALTLTLSFFGWVFLLISLGSSHVPSTPHGGASHVRGAKQHRVDRDSCVFARL